MTFRARLRPVPHGGQYVEVPDELATAAGLEHAARVRGTVNGVAYRSSLMKYSGVFHLGLHKAALTRAGVARGALVEVSLERDPEPLPTDIVPEDLAMRLKRDHDARAAWQQLRPSLKREYVKQLLTAKQPETRARRLDKVMRALSDGGGAFA